MFGEGGCWRAKQRIDLYRQLWAVAGNSLSAVNPIPVNRRWPATVPILPTIPATLIAKVSVNPAGLRNIPNLAPGEMPKNEAETEINPRICPII